MAKQYSDKLGEEASKGMLEKAEQGIWPSFASVGYLNVPGPDGKKVIEPELDFAAIVTKLFEPYATGLYSVRDLAVIARQARIKPRNGREPSTGAIHFLLTNKLYSGEFDWKGKTYQGRHAPLVNKELWDLVQEILERRHKK